MERGQPSTSPVFISENSGDRERLNDPQTPIGLLHVLGDPHSPVGPSGDLDIVEGTRIRDASPIVEITPSFPSEIINSGPSSPNRRHAAKDTSWGHVASKSSLLPIPAPNERESSPITATIDKPSHHAGYDEYETSPSDRAFSPRSPARANWGSLRVEIPEVGEAVEDSPAENFTIPRLQHTNRTIPSKLWGRVSCQSNHGQELDDSAPIWKAYQNEATKHDQTMIDGWSGDMDVLLVFAGLFSAVLTTFLIEFYKQLQPDSGATSAALLRNIAITLQCISNNSTCMGLSPVPPDTFTPDRSVRLINGLWFFSLTLSLTVSALAILAKHWVHAYQSGLTGQPRRYAYTRQFRYNGVVKWHMDAIIGALPTAMFASVFLFFTGLLVLLQQLDPEIFKSCLSIVVLMVVGYIVTSVLPFGYPDCPFQTPASQLVAISLSYTVQFCWRCRRSLLKVTSSVWAFLEAMPSPWSQSVARIKPDHTHAKIMINRALNIQQSYTTLAERQRWAVQWEIPQLEAQTLVWLSHHTHDPQVHEETMRAIPGLRNTPQVAQILKHRTFKSLEHSLRSSLHDRFPAQPGHLNTMFKTFTSLQENSQYHDQIACYAQGFMYKSELEYSYIVCHGLQWYSILLPMRKTEHRAIPLHCLSQAIQELKDSILVLSNALYQDPDNSESSAEMLRIVLYLLVETLLTLYVFYHDDASVKSEISMDCTGIVQYLIDKDIQERYRMASHWLKDSALSFCLIATLQALEDITPASTFLSCWADDNGSPETIGRILLDGIYFILDHKSGRPPVGLPSTWKLLQMLLRRCPSIRQERTAIDLVLAICTKTPMSQRRAWSADEEHCMRWCLRNFSPESQPQDAFTTIQMFDHLWYDRPEASIRKVLNSLDAELSHAEHDVSSQMVQQLVGYHEANLNTADLTAVSVLLKNVSHAGQYSPKLHLDGLRRLLTSVRVVLMMRIDVTFEEWFERTDWKRVFALATSCQHLAQQYKSTILSSGLISALDHVSNKFSRAPSRYYKSRRLVHPGQVQAFHREVAQLKKLFGHGQVVPPKNISSPMWTYSDTLPRS